MAVVVHDRSGLGRQLLIFAVQQLAHEHPLPAHRINIRHQGDIDTFYVCASLAHLLDQLWVRDLDGDERLFGPGHPLHDAGAQKQFLQMRADHLMIRRDIRLTLYRVDDQLLDVLRGLILDICRKASAATSDDACVFHEFDKFFH